MSQVTAAQAAANGLGTRPPEWQLTEASILLVFWSPKGLGFCLGIKRQTQGCIRVNQVLRRQQKTRGRDFPRALHGYFIEDLGSPSKQEWLKLLLQV